MLKPGLFLYAWQKKHCKTFCKKRKEMFRKHFVFVVYPYLFPKQAVVFMILQYKSIENTVEKGEIAHDQKFLHFPQCFLP